MLYININVYIYFEYIFIYIYLNIYILKHIYICFKNILSEQFHTIIGKGTLM